MTPVTAILDEPAMTLAARLARIRERARARNREVTRVASAATHRDRGDPKAGAGPQRRAQTAMQPSAARPARLAKASDRVTRAEQQVLLRLIAQIERRAPGAPPTAETPFEVTADGLCKLFGISPQQGYDLLRKATDRLARRWVTIHAPDPQHPALEATKTPLVHAIDCLPADGRLRVYLAPRVLPYLTQLAAAFAQYRPRSAERPPMPDWALRPCDDLIGRRPRKRPDLANESGRSSGWAGEPSR